MYSTETERMRQVLHAVGIEPGEAPCEQFQEWYEDVVSKTTKQPDILSEAHEVLARLCSDGRASETFLTAKGKSIAKVAEWIEQWVKTGEFWPDEAFDYF